jgi:hypothetical protein
MTKIEVGKTYKFRLKQEYETRDYFLYNYCACVYVSYPHSDGGNYNIWYHDMITTERKESLYITGQVKSIQYRLDSFIACEIILYDNDKFGVIS